MNNDKTISDNNQEGKLALEGNDATFPTSEEIKQILKKKPNQGNANDEPTPNQPTTNQTKSK